MAMTQEPRISAGELAAQLDGVLAGDAAAIIMGVATLEDAGPEELSWVGDVSVLPRLAKSRAGVVLVPADCAIDAPRSLIRVADPDAAIGAALTLLAPPVDAVPAGVDPTAIVAADAVVEGACVGPRVVIGSGTRIGAGTQLHAGVVVGSRCTIGRDCVLWPNVVVRERTEMHDRVVLHPGVIIGSDGFGYQQRDGKHIKIPQIGRVVIEADVEIGANTCVDRARSGETRIGRGTKIDNLVQIGHNVRVGDDCIIVSQCGISGSTTLGRHVVLAGQVGLIDHLNIGSGVVVAAQSGVTGDIPDGKVYRGSPAVENGAYTRQAVGFRRLPQIMQQLKDLTRRVEQLESPAND
jgi:UDP-3-O-[3-hydroxymyristoyl] glucosamine N-acyltransferase